MPRKPTSLDAEAVAKGYKDETEMLLDLYKTQSLRQIGEMFGMSQSFVRTRLLRAGAVLKSRGGPNNVVYKALEEDEVTKGEHV